MNPNMNTEQMVTEGGDKSLKTMKIAVNAVTHQILTSGLYENRPRSALQEMVANAIDASRSANTVTPIEISLPSSLNDILIVKDYGTGMSQKELEEHAFVFGMSTKHDNTGAVGGFGIGLNSILSIASSATFITTKNGITTRAVVLNNGHESQYTIISSKEEGMEQGTIIEVIPSAEWLKSNSFNESDVRNWLEYIEYPLVINNVPLENKVKRNSVLPIIVGESLYPRFVVVGGFKINISRTYFNSLESPLIYELPIGLVKLSPSRENIEQTDANKQAIKNYIETQLLKIPFISKILANFNIVDFLTNVELLGDISKTFKETKITSFRDTHEIIQLAFAFHNKSATPVYARTIAAFLYYDLYDPKHRNTVRLTSDGNAVSIQGTSDPRAKVIEYPEMPFMGKQARLINPETIHVLTMGKSKYNYSDLFKEENRERVLEILEATNSTSEYRELLKGSLLGENDVNFVVAAYDRYCNYHSVWHGQISDFLYDSSVGKMVTNHVGGSDLAFFTRISSLLKSGKPVVKRKSRATTSVPTNCLSKSFSSEVRISAQTISFTENGLVFGSETVTASQLVEMHKRKVKEELVIVTPHYRYGAMSNSLVEALGLSIRLPTLTKLYLVSREGVYAGNNVSFQLSDKRYISENSAVIRIMEPNRTIKFDKVLMQRLKINMRTFTRACILNNAYARTSASSLANNAEFRMEMLKDVAGLKLPEGFKTIEAYNNNSRLVEIEDVDLNVETHQYGSACFIPSTITSLAHLNNEDPLYKALIKITKTHFNNDFKRITGA